MLSKMINRYVEEHQRMGFKFRTQNYLLQNFSRFAQKNGDKYVQINTVLEWAKKAPSQPQKRNRLLTIRRFAIKMQSEDTRYEVPSPDAFGRETFKRRLPHILSSIELRLLLIASLKLKPLNTNRPLIYNTLFSLLAATGLRISEALNLNLDDITEDGLVIRSTKFRKDRLVPLHESSRKAIQDYLNYRIKYIADHNTLFISDSGKRLSYSIVNNIFLQLTRSINLRKEPGYPGLCIHDLRHRFAVRSLEQCKNNREDVDHHIVALSTYLGHAHISDTYWYLQASPILMKKIVKNQETFYKRMRNE
jgi:integrase